MACDNCKKIPFRYLFISDHFYRCPKCDAMYSFSQYSAKRKGLTLAFIVSLVLLDQSMLNTVEWYLKWTEFTKFGMLVYAISCFKLIMTLLIYRFRPLTTVDKEEH